MYNGSDFAGISLVTVKDRDPSLPGAARQLFSSSVIIIFYSNLRNYFYFMSMSAYLHVCIYTTCMLGTHRGQKKTLKSLELELQSVLSHPVVCSELRSSRSSASAAAALAR